MLSRTVVVVRLLNISIVCLVHIIIIPLSTIFVYMTAQQIRI